MMTEGVSIYISLFSDYGKLLRKINHNDCEEFQNDLNQGWTTFLRVGAKISQVSDTNFFHVPTFFHI